MGSATSRKITFEGREWHDCGCPVLASDERGQALVDTLRATIHEQARRCYRAEDAADVARARARELEAQGSASDLSEAQRRIAELEADLARARRNEADLARQVDTLTEFRDPQPPIETAFLSDDERHGGIVYDHSVEQPVNSNGGRPPWLPWAVAAGAAALALAIAASLRSDVEAPTEPPSEPAVEQGLDPFMPSADAAEAPSDPQVAQEVALEASESPEPNAGSGQGNPGASPPAPGLATTLLPELTPSPLMTQPQPPPTPRPPNGVCTDLAQDPDQLRAEQSRKGRGRRDG